MSLGVGVQFLTCGKGDPVVAEFGRHKITLAEFRIAYLNLLKEPNTFDSPRLREEFLDELIRRRLLAEEARRLGLDRDERLRLRTEAFRDRCAREAHYARVIRPRVRTDERSLREIYQYFRERRRLKHLFAETRAQADSLYAALQRGVPFDSLARVVFRDSILSRNGGDLGWVTWDQLDYDLAMTAFRLPLNVYSPPVPSQFGYHILMVTGYERVPIVTETEYQMRRPRIKALAEYKIGDKLAAEYIRNLMARKKIQVNPQLLQFVGSKLTPLVRRQPSTLEFLQGKGLDEEEIGQAALSLWDVRHETLATVDGEPMTVAWFVNSLAYVPRDALNRSYKTALDFALRDFAITQEAKKMGLDRSLEVRRKVRLYEDYVLKVMMTRKLVREVSVSEAEMRDYYERRRADLFRSVPFDSVRTLIRDRLLDEKRRRLLPEHLQQLAQGMAIRKHPEILHRYYERLYREKEGVP
ncbi:MAG: peptidylprolyl isomerase [candidate division KSB1 bacterium]|nr:peptidylprolyl isomerase [candidate division KSB1 bacterium]